MDRYITGSPYTGEPFCSQGNLAPQLFKFTSGPAEFFSLLFLSVYFYGWSWSLTKVHDSKSSRASYACFLFNKPLCSFPPTTPLILGTKTTSFHSKNIRTSEGTWMTCVSLRKMKDAITKLDRFQFPHMKKMLFLFDECLTVYHLPTSRCYYVSAGFKILAKSFQPSYLAQTTQSQEPCLWKSSSTIGHIFL